MDNKRKFWFTVFQIFATAPAVLYVLILYFLTRRISYTRAEFKALLKQNAKGFVRFMILFYLTLIFLIIWGSIA